mmetsp:Transcript_18534/g.34334  ORF Transcript_18534/g.34334 Transcript_18534/m.34334 type:complete len:319 (+) Transcript_18534:1342-2298(+)
MLITLPRPAARLLVRLPRAGELSSPQQTPLLPTVHGVRRSLSSLPPSPLEVESLPPSDRRRSEKLRAACAQALAGAKSNKVIAARATVPLLQQDSGIAALVAAILPSSSPYGAHGDESETTSLRQDLEADIHACVRAWAQATGRDRPFVQLTLSRKPPRTLLHIDHVDVRVLCTVFGSGTEWVNPAFATGWLHWAASWMDSGRGGALADFLKARVQQQCENGSLFQAAKERQVVVIRGTAHPDLPRGLARLHRGPKLLQEMSDWRLLIKVDDGPGWWRADHLKHLYRPPESRQQKTWAQHLVARLTGRTDRVGWKKKA